MDKLLASHRPLTALRDAITNAYRMDETACLNQLLPKAEAALPNPDAVAAVAAELIERTRDFQESAGRINKILQKYDLSSAEGVALMCMAEALLRIPDKATMDKFISDKLSTANWKNHLDKDDPLFLNATTWSLLLTGKIYAPMLRRENSLSQYLTKAISHLGVAVIRPIIFQMMKAIGKQFVLGENIQEALENAQVLAESGYRFSYDMLGEAARTQLDATQYYQAYVNAIHAIGQSAKTRDPRLNPGISVKLSALHPRFEYTQEEQLLQTLPTVLLALCQLAKQYHIGLTVDAEEADRLDLMLNIIEKVFNDASLNDWDGFGIAVQAYQKRASYVIDWLAALCAKKKKRMMVRLVKGAYWDAEIKLSQMLGLNDYPVFTRKYSTDVSYLACAQQLISHANYFYAQFGTHNAYTVAAIIAMQPAIDQFEFQCLQGMGQALYHQIVDANNYNLPCRIYAPVGTHRDLLPYLVRRLLENGANSSFVNKLADKKIPISDLVINPIAYIRAKNASPHPRIPNPKDIYKAWSNSLGIDLSDHNSQIALQQHFQHQPIYKATSIINGKNIQAQASHAIRAPANQDHILGHVSEADDETVMKAINAALKSRGWQQTSVNERAIVLEKAALLLETAMPNLVTLLSDEAGKCLADSIAEVREAIDFCRYYALRAREDLITQELPGPTGEYNAISYHPRGVVVCISPWNFPLAIFCGQIIAALAAGNAVIAKPAEQTPLIAYQAIKILHLAGVPVETLQFLPGKGDEIGNILTQDDRIAGVIFTGSTATAKLIEKNLTARKGAIAFLIAETGGQNAMIVDSSALAEQVILDVCNSAFNSAGQRCSALRVLYVQEEMAPKLIAMLKGYMAELNVGDPRKLSTDIGPVIDYDALTILKSHVEQMHRVAKCVAEVPLKKTLPGFYLQPVAFELTDLSLLDKEIFGPVLHIVRYPAAELDKVLDAITGTGFGLTLGIHSRISSTVDYIVSRVRVGNIYVNRNIIGAVVGVQPFGGEGLSGTGPKAGGYHYLTRLCVERAISNNTTAIGGNARLISLLEDD